MKPLPLTLAVFTLIALIVAATTAAAEVVRPAPDFTWSGGKSASLKGLRGQPVVLIVATSPKSSAFRKQVKRLEAEYTQFAARGAVFAAAFTEASSDSGTVKSNIPFVIAKDGEGVASRYGVTSPFALIVVGRDGNMDLLTAKVSPASLVRDVILNNAELQSAERRL
ncbi:MAG: redoxin domain-containing protein [Verrucomicrobiota bacterium]